MNEYSNTMEVQSDLLEPTTPMAPDSKVFYRKTEDSGYHTSFTPGSVDCCEKPNKNNNHVQYDRSEVNIHLDCKYRAKIAQLSTPNEKNLESPRYRRGVKRIYQDVADENSYTAVRTPTTLIAGGIQELKVSDINRLYHTSFATSSVKSEYSDSAFSDLRQSDYTHALSFPSTPIKKICRSSCNISPMKKSPKRLNFAIHSLSCASNGLQLLNKNRPHYKVVRSMQFRPEQRIDIIKMLQERARPPLAKIFSYLTNEDICNFNLVSHTWCHIWNEVSNRKQKLEHKIYLENVKKNVENRYKVLTPKNYDVNQIKGLKEEHNILNVQVTQEIHRSPPGTPRTNKFRKFAKCASLGSLLQKCVRCELPAKVTKETSGEEWVQCMNNTCSYQFCRSCNCARHPGKICLRYDLNGPSPSKRKKNSCVIGSLKSKRSLRRLL